MKTAGLILFALVFALGVPFVVFRIRWRRRDRKRTDRRRLADAVKQWELDGKAIYEADQAEREERRKREHWTGI